MSNKFKSVVLFLKILVTLVLSRGYKVEVDDDNNVIDNRQSFSNFYLPNIMVKGYNVIIDKLAFFDLPVKTEEEANEKVIVISKNNEYTTGKFIRL